MPDRSGSHAEDDWLHHGARLASCHPDKPWGRTGFTHLRELLFNMATIAFQTLPEGPLPDAIDGSPPHFVGQCLAWDVNGSVVKRHYPAFVGWQPKVAGN